MHSTCLTLTLQTKTIAIRCASLTRSFCHFQQVSRYVSYRDPSIAIRIVSWGYRIVTTLILDQLTDLDARRQQRGYLSDKDVGYEEYVGFLRPTTDPTHEPVAYTGIPRHEAVPLYGSQDWSFTVYHESSTKHINMYMRNLVGVYNQMYTVDNSLIGDPSNPYRISTLCRTSPSLSVCDTTLLLEEAMDLNNVEMAALDSSEVSALSNYHYRHTKAESAILENVPRFTRTDSKFTRLAIASRFGYSVPYTHRTEDMPSTAQGACSTTGAPTDFSRQERKGIPPNGCILAGEWPMAHEIVSPYTMPAHCL